MNRLSKRKIGLSKDIKSLENTTLSYSKCYRLKGTALQQNGMAKIRTSLHLLDLILYWKRSTHTFRGKKTQTK